MKKLLCLLLTLLVSFSVKSENWKWHCGKVQNVDTWTIGSDNYGVQFKLESTPSECYEFYLPHNGENKSLAYSAILGAKFQSGQVCVQYKAESENFVLSNLNFCKANAVRLP